MQPFGPNLLQALFIKSLFPPNPRLSSMPSLRPQKTPLTDSYSSPTKTKPPGNSHSFLRYFRRIWTILKQCYYYYKYDRLPFSLFSSRQYTHSALQNAENAKSLIISLEGLDIPRLTSAHQNEIKIKGCSTSSVVNNTNVTVTITTKYCPYRTFINREFKYYERNDEHFDFYRECFLSKYSFGSDYSK